MCTPARMLKMVWLKMYDPVSPAPVSAVTVLLSPALQLASLRNVFRSQRPLPEHIIPVPQPYARVSQEAYGSSRARYAMSTIGLGMTSFLFLH